MRFFRKPPTGRIRREFVWWPRKSLVLEYQYLATGEAEKPYTPGIVNGGFGLSSYPPSTRKQVAAASGGMFTPVRGEQVAARDCWMWLEYEVRQLQTFHMPDGKQVTWWKPVLLPKQWNVFYEYD